MVLFSRIERLPETRTAWPGGVNLRREGHPATREAGKVFMADQVTVQRGGRRANEGCGLFLEPPSNPFFFLRRERIPLVELFFEPFLFFG